MSIILITHDLAVVARMADRVAVMYAGQIVESGTVDEIFYESAHPYTLGLRAAMPSNKTTREKKLTPILGSPPDLFHPPTGCGYFARCPYAMKSCEKMLTSRVSTHRRVKPPIQMLAPTPGCTQGPGIVSTRPYSRGSP
jgi:oligopeptide/dipeptide ABC transporter ATP-binding protein